MSQNDAPRSPNCDACGQATALLRAEPHPKFANMLQRVFVCRCGTLTSDIIAATVRRPVPSSGVLVVPAPDTTAA